MTFVLKEFKELKEQFEITKGVYLKDYKKDKIEALEEPRREQFMFLAAIIAELDKRIAAATNKEQITKQATAILNAAERVVVKDIYNLSITKSTAKSSSVSKSLNEAMGISSSNKPDEWQLTATAQELSQFLTLVYVDNDSRKGLNPEHALSAINLDKLERLIKTSLLLEEEYSQKKNRAFATALSSSATVANYVPAKITPPVIKLISWSELLDAFQKLVIDEIAAHKKKEKAHSISTITGPRAIQLGFLDVIKKLLSSEECKLNELDKSAVFSGAMYMVRGLITKKYSTESNPMDKADFEDTLVQTELTRILKMRDSSAEDIDFCLNAASNFLQFFTIERILDKEAISTNNAFSPIKGFDLQTYLDIGLEMSCQCKIIALGRNVAKAKSLLDDNKAKNEAATDNGAHVSVYDTVFSLFLPAKKADPIAKLNLLIEGAVTTTTGATSSTADSDELDGAAPAEQSAGSKP